MKYLLFLNRFDLDRNTITSRLQSLHLTVHGEDHKGLLVEGPSIEEALKLQEVKSAVVLTTSWKHLDYDQLPKDALEAVKLFPGKKYIIKPKYHEKMRSLSAKQVFKDINPTLKREGFTPDEKAPETLLYIEFTRQGNEAVYRISVAPMSWWSPVSASGIDYSPFAVMLENPRLPDEVSDFLRLCWIFKLPLFIVTKDPEFGRVLNKAREITKGIIYEQMQLHVQQSPPKGFIMVGFSKLARDAEPELKKYIQSNSQKLLLTFGDDKFGLTQEMRNKMDVMFRLTPDTRKPLRAAHALSYILGLYSALKV